MDAAMPDWLTVTCQSSPTQIEGISPAGDHVYFRYRWGQAVLSINDELIWAQRYGHAMSGTMDTDLAMGITVTHLAAHAAHQAARAALPVGEVPPLDAQEQALMDRWTATTPPTQD